MRTTQRLSRRSPHRLRERLTAASALLATVAVALSLLPCPAAAQGGYTAEVVASGLNNPRGLAWSDGALYITEAGTGGLGTEITGGEGPLQYGDTGSVTRWTYNGGSPSQQRVLLNLPSLATQAEGRQGSNAAGLVDIVFSGGNAYGVIGLGANPSERSKFTGSENGSAFGQLVQLNFSGSGSAFTTLADIAGFEAANDPDQKGADSNPYGLAVLHNNRFAVVDAGGNSLLNVNGSTVSLSTTFVKQPDNPGDPVPESVPTAVTVASTSASGSTLFVSELTGFPFGVGTSDIYRVELDANGLATSVSALAQGSFTTVIDLVYGPDDYLYVLQLTTNGIATPTPGNGQLLRVDPTTGASTLLLDDPLVAPGGLTFGEDGALYVTNMGTSPGGGQVLRITPSAAVPEAGTAVLAGSAVGLLALSAMPGLRRRRRSA